MNATETDNASGQGSEAVTCLACTKVTRGWLEFTSRRDGWAGDPHCKACHGNTHRECDYCGKCMPPRSGRHRTRLDRRYCSSTCRVYGMKARERKAAERALWEESHPEEAAQERAGFEAWLSALREIGDSPEVAERKRLARELRDAAEVCNRCKAPLTTVYRRREHEHVVNAPVLALCAAHRCLQRDGHHNRDVVDTGQYFPSCRCEDRHWTSPEPCLACARPVSWPRNAGWRRGRGWFYHDEQRPADPRVFCGNNCKRLVLRAESKAQRLATKAAAEKVKCPVCLFEVRPTRGDVTYCSNACRQRAYRQRKAATA